MNMTVRSFLFPSKPALHFIYNAYYYYFNNFQTNNLGVDILGKSNIRTVLSSQGEPLLVSILKHPEEYVRYFNKVPLFLHTKKAGWLAPAVTLPFYLYFKLRVKSRSK